MIAGGGNSGADGIPAAQATVGARAIVVGRDDTVFVLDASGRIRSFRPGGIINTLAGIIVNGAFPNGDGGPARRAILDTFGSTAGLAVGPDGSVCMAQNHSDRSVRRVAPIVEHFVAGELFVPAADGSEVFVFTPEGRHLRTMDALMGVVRYQFTYDALGQLATIVDLSGNVTTIERDGKGLPSGILGPFGQRTTIEIDAEGYLSQVTNPAGESVQLGYAPGGLLAAFTKPGRQISNYAYDPLGRVVTATDPTGATKTLTRSGLNKDHTVTVTTALGRVSTFQTTRASNQDLLLTTTDPAGAQSHLLISQNGSQSSTNKGGTTVKMELGPDPRWGMRAPIPTNITVKTPNGLILTSAVQRAVTLASAGAFPSLSTLTNKVTVNGRTFTAIYNGSTRTLTYTWPTGRQQKVVLDDLGRVVQGQLGDLEPTSVAYDARGRFASVTAGIAGNSRTTAFAYAANGFLASITDALGHKSGLTTDAAGRIADVTRPGGAIVGLNYDANGNVARLTPPGRPSHLFAYTARDEASSYTAPVVGTENSQAALAYNADRLPTRVQRPSGETNSWQYDSAGRLSLSTLPTGQRTYAYDPSAA
jgi:YD repeat-containing protein